jgi:kinesin family protein 5
VVCRFRPLNEKEKSISLESCVEFVDDSNIILKSSENQHMFSFDKIFNTYILQQEVYEWSAKPIVESVLEGFNGTIFAYGQTGSGKTHTMQGALDDPEEEGIIPRMIRYVFNHIFTQSSSDVEFTVKVSMLEIYMEKIKDLIIPDKVNLNIREDKAKGIYIESLSEHYASSEEEVLDLMRQGSENRVVGTTNMNEHSSRSHSIFIMTIHQTNTKDGVSKTGKLYLVDLAGSEKAGKSGAQGITLEEAKNINKSLTTLGMVINNLTDGKSTYIPYRDSKLTRVLQESLGGNAKTCLIIACSCSPYNEAETLSTLRFGMRAKKIKNKPKINKEITVMELKSEIDKLEGMLFVCKKRISQLENYITSHDLKVPAENDFSFTKLEKIKIDEKINYETLITNIPNIEFDTTNFHTNNQIDKKIENLLIDNRDLNARLDDAEKRILMLSADMKDKESIINELNKIKQEFDSKEYELQEKICELQEKLDIQENAIKRNDPIVDDIYIKIQDILKTKVDTKSKFINFFNTFKNKLTEITNTDLSGLILHESDKNVEEINKKEKIKHDSEKMLILKTLDDRSERINLLDCENRELKERIKLLESKMNPDDKNYVKKIMTLEKNLEQVNQMYHQVVTQKSVLKIENQVFLKIIPRY